MRADAKQQPIHDDQAPGVACLSTPCFSTGAAEVADIAANVKVFQGEFTDTDVNNMDFVNFLSENDGKVIYLRGDFGHFYIDERLNFIEKECHSSRYRRLIGFEKFNDAKPHFARLKDREIALPTRHDERDVSIYAEKFEYQQPVSINCGYSLVLHTIKNEFEVEHGGLGLDGVAIKGFFEIEAVHPNNWQTRFHLRERKAPLALRLRMESTEPDNYESETGEARDAK